MVATGCLLPSSSTPCPGLHSNSYCLLSVLVLPFISCFAVRCSLLFPSVPILCTLLTTFRLLFWLGVLCNSTSTGESPVSVNIFLTFSPDEHSLFDSFSYAQWYYAWNPQFIVQYSVKNPFFNGWQYTSHEDFILMFDRNISFKNPL